MRFHGSWLILFVLVAVGCSPAGEQSGDLAPAPPAPRIDATAISIVDGQTVYVPVYSQIRMMDGDRTAMLAVTLSIRNSDAQHPISIERVDYFDSDGTLVEQFLTGPREVGPMATLEFFVPERDPRGGSGANFIVRWSAEDPVYEPVVEAIMVGTGGPLSLSLISQGRPYARRLGPAAADR